MTARLLSENLLSPIADLIEEFEETALRINGSLRITFSIKKGEINSRLEYGGSMSASWESKCSIVDLPLKAGVYKLIYGPPVHLFAHTLTPLIIHHNSIINIDTLPVITLSWRNVIERSRTLQGKALFSSINFTDSKSGNTRSIAFGNNISIEDLMGSGNRLIDIWASDTIIVLLLSIGPRNKEIQSAVSTREAVRKKLVQKMRDSVKKNMPEAKNVKGSPLGGSVEFTLDKEGAREYGFPASGRITLAPEGTSIASNEKYFTYKERKRLEGTSLGREMINWTERMYNISRLPERDKELMQVYRTNFGRVRFLPTNRFTKRRFTGSKDHCYNDERIQDHALARSHRGLR